MKKLLLNICILFFAAFNVGAQCVPDTNITHNVPGIYPDTIVNLPHGYVGLSYSTDIQIKVLTDTTYQGFPAIVDSIAITSVSGLPWGFAYTCTPPSCVFPGGSNACIYLYGSSPTGGIVGTYPIVVNINIYGRVFGIPQTVQQSNTGYTIVIENNVGIVSFNNNEFAVEQNIPNPVASQTIIPFNLPRNASVQFRLINLLGKQVINQEYKLTKGSNNIPVNVSMLPAGIYLYTVSYGTNSVTKRMIVTEK